MLWLTIPLSRMEPDMGDRRRGDLLDLSDRSVPRGRRRFSQVDVGRSRGGGHRGVAAAQDLHGDRNDFAAAAEPVDRRLLLGQIGMLGGLSSTDLGLKNPDDLFIAMLKSRTIQDRLIDQFDLRKAYGVKRYQDARKKLENRSYIVAET